MTEPLADDSDRALDKVRSFHARKKTFDGHRVLGDFPYLKALFDEVGIKTMIDYGCGKGIAYAPPNYLDKRLGVRASLYDPGVPGIDILPAGIFDAAVVVSVLEYVPLVTLDSTLEEIFDYATKCVFLRTSCRPPRKQILTEPYDRQREFWISHITLAAAKKPDVLWVCRLFIHKPGEYYEVYRGRGDSYQITEYYPPRGQETPS